MWGNVEKTIQIIESRIDLINKKTYLYDIQYCSIDNEYCSLKYSHIIGKFVPMKRHMLFCMGLSTNVNPLMNDSLSWKVFFIQDGKISPRHFHQLAMNSYLHQKISPWQIMYPMKQKDIFDYDTRCIMSSGLMFDDIVMDIIRNNELPHSNE